MDAAPSATSTSIYLIEAKYRSTTITSIVAAAAVVVTLFYLAALYLVAHRWAWYDTSLNKYSSVRLQRSAPCTILFVSWRFPWLTSSNSYVLAVGIDEYH